MYIQIGIVSLMLVCIYAAPIDECNKASCDGVTITTANTTRTIAYAGNKRFFYSCISDSKNYKRKYACLKCPHENQIYVERCEMCIAPEYENNCTKPVLPTAAPVDRDCGDLADEDNCNGKKNGTYQLAGNTKKFYSCHMEERAKYCNTCPQGTIHSDKCQQCVFYNASVGTEDEECFSEGNTTQGANRCPDAMCKGKLDGDYEMEGADGNNQFYKCAGQSGICYLFNCPEYTYFSKACEACTFTYKDSSDKCVKYEKVTAKPITCPAGACQDKESGYYADGSDANKFYYCRKSEVMAGMYVYSCENPQRCPGNLYYNEENGRCGPQK